MSGGEDGKCKCKCKCELRLTLSCACYYTFYFLLTITTDSWACVQVLLCLHSTFLVPSVVILATQYNPQQLHALCIFCAVFGRLWALMGVYGARLPHHHCMLAFFHHLRPSCTSFEHFVPSHIIQ